MSDKSKRDAQRASGTDALASCTLTDADGNPVFIGDWLSEAEPSDSDESEEAERRPKRKGSLREQWLRGDSQTKSSSEGIWRTTDDGSRIFIEGDGTVRAGGPEGKVIATGSDGKPDGKESDRPESDSGDNAGVKPNRGVRVENLKVYNGGHGKEGRFVTYHTTNKEMAESYVDMFNERFGEGGKLNERTITIESPAPWEVVRREAIRLGMDADDYTPASVFDDNLFEAIDVKTLIARLEKLGHDGAVLPDIAYGRDIQDDAYITFTKPKPRPQTKSILERSRGFLQATAKSAGERWITIGGDSSAPKGERGGTPVMISGDGEILKGPRDLKGENLKDLGDSSKRKKKPKPKKPPERPQVTLEQEKELQALREERDRKLAAAREANDDEAVNAAREEFTAKRRAIIGDVEERSRQWDNDRAREKIDDVRKRLKELEGKKPWEMTVVEFHLVPMVKRADQAKKDLAKWGGMLDDYAAATEAGDWDKQEAAIKKLEETRGFEALKKRVFAKGDYRSMTELRERLTNIVDAIEKQPHEFANPWNARTEHEAQVKKQVEKDVDSVLIENLRQYSWRDWIPEETKVKIAKQDSVDFWQSKKDSDEFRKQAREGRKVSNLANAAVDTFREEVLQMPVAERQRLSQEYTKVYNEYEAAAAKSDVDTAMKAAQRAADMYEKLKAMPKDDTRPIDKIVQATGGKTATFKADIEGDVTPEIQSRVDRAIEWLSSAVAPGVVPGTVKIKILKPGEGYHGDSRSYASGETVHLTPNAGTGVVVHEIGHVIEHANERKLGTKSQAFLAAKTFDQKVDHLGKNYDVNEVATKNGFLDAYTGKYYGHGSTEILSMGLQHLYEDPVRFARESPDHFNYTTAVMRGLIE